MIRELATLLQVGVPLLDAIDSVSSQAKRGFRDAMRAVRDQVASGSSLADAMSREAEVFDEMTVGMIRVGEHAGNLDEVCEQVAEFRERSGELKDRVLSALLYPAIVMLVSVGVTIFLMTVVVPMLLQNLTEIGRPLPLPTLVLKWMSDLLLQWGFWIVGGVISACFVAVFLGRTPRGQKAIGDLAFATPILGTLIQKQALSRMSLVVSSLLRSGVELVDALEIAQKSTTNGLLRTALVEMQRDLRFGQDLRDATDRHKIFTRSMGQVFSLGQQSGQLDRMLLRIGMDYDRQAGVLATRITTLIEPLLILVLSVIVGFILFATVLPILEAGNVLAE
ncbi:type II secretion system F family protein [Rubripirellula lacrimiformis]|nr:type II secretion system F family protein [Rubripirellula lacrimiformis]